VKTKFTVAERDRIADVIEKDVRWDEYGCRVWQGATDHDGYGLNRFRRKVWAVHDLVYFIFRGDLPKGMVLSHRCRNKACCNLSHLSLVSRWY
jgi:hypothetical protein